MADVITISSQSSPSPAFNYDELRKLGIQHIEKSASSIWTDYNIHDPGITTLEFLCYAITDLSYRTNYSIPDLLATPADTVKNIHSHFLSAKNIFPNEAVTINDYRRLLIDIEKVKNAWITKSTRSIFADLVNKKLSHDPDTRKWETVTIMGYYDVLLEFDTTVKEEEKQAIKKNARDVLMNSRNLCEDFIHVQEVQAQKFRLCSEIEIAPDAEPFETLALIFFNIQLYLSPLVKFYWLHELVAEKYTSDKIFEGPLLTHGFIKEKELVDSSLKTEIHLSDIMHQILLAKGVQNITDIIFNATTQLTELPNKWVIDVTDGSQPVIDILQSNVVLYKSGMPFRPSPLKVKERFDELMKAYVSGNEGVETKDISYDTGTYRNIGDYYSIQNHYPKNYGISHWGLPEDASSERKIQARQLHGYLYFFDQVLANYLSQLSHIRNVFSLEDEKHTYFTELVKDFNHAEQLFSNPASIKNNIQKATETETEFYRRRNLFLDHLLSRFAESFFEYVSILQSAFPGMNKANIVETKIRFLKDYPEYSSQRFSAYNYTDTINLWDSGNISGLEKRLQRLLGFKNTERKTLVNVYAVIKSAVNAINVNQFWYQINDNRTGKGLMLAAEKYVSGEGAENGLDTFLFLSSDITAFSVREDTSDSKFVIELKDKAGKLAAISNDRYNTQQDANADIVKIVALYSGNQSEEGMFLIEHLLLLPEIKREEVMETSSGTELIATETNTVTGGDSAPGDIIPVEPGPLLDSDPGADNETTNESASGVNEASAGNTETSSTRDRSPGGFIHGAFMPICVDDNCDDCNDKDPYSFRISIVLPALASRFVNMDFRKYCERIIRMETPAHIFPKICWVNNEQLQEFESAYQEWLPVKAGIIQDESNSILQRFVNIFTTLKTVYPPARLQDCKSPEEKKLFLLNQNTLGTLKP